MKLNKLMLPMLLVLGCGGVHAQTSIFGSELGSFGVLGAAAVTSTGATTVAGNLGVSNNSSITGVTGIFGSLANDGPGVVSGAIHQGNAFASLADTQLTMAMTSLGLMGPGTTLGADLTGLTLAPGVYTVPAGTSNLTGTLTLDGQGNANAAWVFQMPSTLITSSGSWVNITNTGSGAGVFWNVGSSATLGSTTSFEGNILASTSITLGSGVTLNCGRALAHTGAVTLNSNTVDAGNCLGTVVAESNGLSHGLTVNNDGSAPQPLAFSPVTAVPEPETYALLLVGLGLIGGAVKRRSAALRLAA